MTSQIIRSGLPLGALALTAVLLAPAISASITGTDAIPDLSSPKEPLATLFINGQGVSEGDAVDVGARPRDDGTCDNPGFTQIIDVPASSGPVNVVARTTFTEACLVKVASVEYNFDHLEVDPAILEDPGDAGASASATWDQHKIKAEYTHWCPGWACADIWFSTTVATLYFKNRDDHGHHEFVNSEHKCDRDDDSLYTVDGCNGYQYQHTTWPYDSDPGAHTEGFFSSGSDSYETNVYAYGKMDGGHSCHFFTTDDGGNWYDYCTKYY